MESPLGIGFVGAGSIVRQRHVPGFRAIAGTRLVTVANRSLASARRGAAEFGITRAVATWREVVEDPDVDAVVVATWPDLHAEVTVAALAAGKHVLTQARMATDAAEARRMLAASEAHPESVAMVVPSPISLFADTAIRRLIAGGAVGDVRMIRLAWSGSVYDLDPWRRLRRYSGNNTMSLGILYEALMRWVGPARATVALAQTVEKEMQGLDGGRLPVDVPDHLIVAVEFPGSMLASIEISATRRSEPNAATFFGTQGALRADFDAACLELAGEDGIWTEAAIGREERGDWRVEQDFVDAIRLDAPVELTDFATGVRYMAFTDAVIASLADGRRVEVAS